MSAGFDSDCWATSASPVTSNVVKSVAKESAGFVFMTVDKGCPQAENGVTRKREAGILSNHYFELFAHMWSRFLT